MKHLSLTLLLSMLLLVGCVTTDPVPDDYSGPTATIRDSQVRNTRLQVDFFYLSKVDDKPLQNARTISRMQSAGRGFDMSIAACERQVLPQEAVFHIVGRTEFAAPIQTFTKKVYQVQGDVRFTPKEKKIYIVKGTLSETYSAVWIEEEETGIIVGDKIEVEGSAALKFFQK